MPHEVTLINGDGTGPELAAAARMCVDATGVKINWDIQEAGVDIMAKNGGEARPGMPQYFPVTSTADPLWPSSALKKARFQTFNRYCTPTVMTTTRTRDAVSTPARGPLRQYPSALVQNRRK